MIVNGIFIDIICDYRKQVVLHVIYYYYYDYHSTSQKKRKLKINCMIARFYIYYILKKGRVRAAARNSLGMTLLPLWVVGGGGPGGGGGGGGGGWGGKRLQPLRGHEPHVENHCCKMSDSSQCERKQNGALYTTNVE